MEGMAQGADPSPEVSFSYCSRHRKELQSFWRVSRGVLKGCPLLLGSQGMRDLVPCGRIEKANLERARAWESHRSTFILTLSGVTSSITCLLICQRRLQSLLPRVL